MPWGIVVDMMNDTDFSNALILSIMAAESGGDTRAVSSAGACGLMQIMWKEWFILSRRALCSSEWANIRKGIDILNSADKRAQSQGYDLRYALAYYNCSEEGVHADKCGSAGGLHYADHVLNFWLPRIETQIDWCVEQYGEDFWYNSNDVDRAGCNW